MALRHKRRWHVLADLVNQHGWSAGAELGVYKGETFRRLLMSCPDLCLTGVDRFDNGHFQAIRKGRPKRTPNLSEYEHALREWIRLQAPERARLMRSDTLGAAQRVEDASLDFVFVDADHRYEAVSADIDAWLPKIRPGGMMLGHDYNAKEFPGVVQAVDERFKERKLYPDHVWGAAC